MGLEGAKETPGDNGSPGPQGPQGDPGPPGSDGTEGNPGPPRPQDLIDLQEKLEQQDLQEQMEILDHQDITVNQDLMTLQGMLEYQRTKECDGCTIYCFLFAVKKFHVFCGLLGNRKTFLAKFCDCVHMNIVEAVNCETFSGNEGRNA